MTAMRNLAQGTNQRTAGSYLTKPQRDRVLREIGRKLEPDPIGIEPGLVTKIAAASGFPPHKILCSPEQPSLSERIAAIQKRRGKRHEGTGLYGCLLISEGLATGPEL